MVFFIFEESLDTVETMVLDANSEASEAVVEWQEVTNEVAELQTVEALEDWFWNLHLIIRYP
jgi:hypothetical protein